MSKSADLKLPLQSERSKVLLVLPQALDPVQGGVQRSTWQMGHDLARRGWHVAFLSLADSGHQQPDCGRLLHPLSAGATSTPEHADHFIEAAVREFRPDIVINQVALAEELAVPINRLRGDLGFRVVACFRNTPSFFRDNHRAIMRNRLHRRSWLFALLDRAPLWWLLRAAHRRKGARRFAKAIRRCDRLMLLSESFESELRWYLPQLDSAMLFFVPNAFSFVPAPPSETKENMLLMVSRMDNAQKNVLLLPELWLRLSSSLPEWELHVVGDGPDRKRMEAAFQEMGKQRVFVHGQQPAADFFTRARIFLMLSSYEGFGNTLVEAQMTGAVPVVFRSFSALDEILNDGKDAVFVPAFDLQAFAAAVTDLAKDPERLQQMSLKAVQNAQRFSEQAIGQRWDDFLREELLSRASEKQP